LTNYTNISVVKLLPAYDPLKFHSKDNRLELQALFRANMILYSVS